MSKVLLIIMAVAGLSGCVTIQRADYAQTSQPLAIELASAKYLYEVGSAADVEQSSLTGASALALKGREKTALSLVQNTDWVDEEDGTSDGEYADWE